MIEELGTDQNPLNCCCSECLAAGAFQKGCFCTVTTRTYYISSYCKTSKPQETSVITNSKLSFTTRRYLVRSLEVFEIISLLVVLLCVTF